MDDNRVQNRVANNEVELNDHLTDVNVKRETKHEPELIIHDEHDVVNCIQSIHDDIDERSLKCYAPKLKKKHLVLV